jgi:hypothetical protein
VGSPGSPKSHLYVRSWKGSTSAVEVVPVALKNTASGATPVVRLGLKEAVMPCACPLCNGIPDRASTSPNAKHEPRAMSASPSVSDSSRTLGTPQRCVNPTSDDPSACSVTQPTGEGAGFWSHRIRQDGSITSTYIVFCRPTATPRTDPEAGMERASFRRGQGTQGVAGRRDGGEDPWT